MIFLNRLAKIPVFMTAFTMLAQIAVPIASAQSPATQGRTAIDEAWGTLQAEKHQVDVTLEAEDKAARQNKEVPKNKANRSSDLLNVANKARGFYQNNPGHSKASQARKMEVFALIRAKAEGDPSAENRLTQTVSFMVADKSIPEKLRSEVAAARAFSKETRGIKNKPQRFTAIERVSRKHMRDYPTQPQAYQALLVVAQASDSRKSAALARDIVRSSAPAEMKHAAQLILDRQSLIGRSLADVGGQPINTLLSEVPSDTPVIVYSWATWGHGSIALGRMIDGRRFAAIGICLDENISAAQKAKRAANLGGQHLYDPKGLKGASAARLKFSNAGQIYLVDKQGVIRDVHGDRDLEQKLRDLDFKTPEVKAPEFSL